MWSVLGTRSAQIDSQALRNQIRQRWRKNVFLVACLFQVCFSSLEAQASGFIFSLLRLGENKGSKQALRGLCRALGLTFRSLEHSSLKPSLHLRRKVASSFAALQAKLTENCQWFWVLQVFMLLICYLKMEFLKAVLIFFFFQLLILKLQEPALMGRLHQVTSKGFKF